MARHDSFEEFRGLSGRCSFSSSTATVSPLAASALAPSTPFSCPPSQTSSSSFRSLHGRPPQLVLPQPSTTPTKSAYIHPATAVPPFCGLIGWLWLSFSLCRKGRSKSSRVRRWPPEPPATDGHTAAMVVEDDQPHQPHRAVEVRRRLSDPEDAKPHSSS